MPGRPARTGRAVTKADKERQQRIAKFYRERAAVRAAVRAATEKTAREFGIKLPEIVVDLIRGMPLRTVGTEVRYKFGYPPEDPRLTMTWLAFYESMMFLVNTMWGDSAV